MTTISTTPSLRIRRSDERGFADHGWLKSFHTFSFAGYHDPDFMGFRSLRVINDDIIAPNGGFPMHPHHNMEIFSYIVEGAIQHRDTMGNERVLKPGDVQLMSTGRGIEHSEYNPSATEPLHLLQIWISPSSSGLPPSYTEWKPSIAQADEKKTLIISPNGEESSAVINQDVKVYRVLLASGESIQHNVAPHRAAWIQIIKGSLTIDKTELEKGDAASTEEVGTLTLKATSPAEALIFDLA